MATLPAAVASIGRVRGLRLLGQGKVRDTYEVPHRAELLLPRASNRISIYDHVLPPEVPRKGEVLNAANVFMRTQVLVGIPHDLVAFGAGIDAYLPPELRGNADLQARATIVRRLDMLEVIRHDGPVKVEAVMRRYLAGSALAAYEQGQAVCGHVLPPGLTVGSKLDRPIFTPTTKAEIGHDQPLDVSLVNAQEPELVQMAELCYDMAANWAESRGIILADTKLEFGRDLNLGEPLILADEAFTPDSSRFWDADEWRDAHAHGREPRSYDKQFVRNWGRPLGIQSRKPENPDDVAWVHNLTVPPDVIAETTRLYLEIFERLTGMSLDTFQEQVMHIRPAA